jgi:hypothetical protein
LRAHRAFGINCGDQSHEAIFVGDYGGVGISISLTSKFFANNRFVISHTNAALRLLRASSAADSLTLLAYRPANTMPV